MINIDAVRKIKEGQARRLAALRCPQGSRAISLCLYEQIDYVWSIKRWWMA